MLDEIIATAKAVKKGAEQAAKTIKKETEKSLKEIEKKKKEEEKVRAEKKLAEQKKHEEEKKQREEKRLAEIEAEKKRKAEELEKQQREKEEKWAVLKTSTEKRKFDNIFREKVGTFNGKVDMAVLNKTYQVLTKIMAEKQLVVDKEDKSSRESFVLHDSNYKIILYDCDYMSDFESVEIINSEGNSIWFSRFCKEYRFEYVYGFGLNENVASEIFFRSAKELYSDANPLAITCKFLGIEYFTDIINDFVKYLKQIYEENREKERKEQESKLKEEAEKKRKEENAKQRKTQKDMKNALDSF